MARPGPARPRSGGATPFGPRTRKDRIEEALFARRRDLLNQSLAIVFFDTTSIYFEGAGGQTLGRRGHSKGHRPDLAQVVVGVVLDADGTPVCSEVWPGDTTDVKTLIPFVDRLKQTFHVERVCIVADLGMISQETIEAIEERDWFYILGVRMRSSNEARAVVDAEGPFTEVSPERETSHDPSPLQVNEIHVGEHRYIVCLNAEQARKDRHDRDPGSPLRGTQRNQGLRRQGVPGLQGGHPSRATSGVTGARGAVQEVGSV